MADATCTQTPEREMSATYQLLEAIFEAFWRKLESRLTPTDTTEAPPETPPYTPRRPTANIKGPTYLRWRRRPKRCTAEKSYCCQALRQYNSSTTKRETRRTGEMRGEHLLTEDLQQLPFVESLRSQAIWDANFPVTGIG
ncbi:Hypothetical predicted protein [Pelobates cultripes]|uniref:Uncharacterized protein n=1 Tax=Pelobates cultripes TaxID=61616 RepID=A0AAD1RBE6_PELCU|nr:Hypothetical predicted protein [Pelobates cultripes]